jgi:hypothetical protein
MKKTKVRLPASQEVDAVPYPEPDESSLCQFHNIYLIRILTFTLHLHLGLPIAHFLLYVFSPLQNQLLSYSTCLIDTSHNINVDVVVLRETLNKAQTLPVLRPERGCLLCK